MLKLSIKSSFLSLALLTSSQLTLATKVTEQKKGICSYVTEACQRVFSCFKKKNKGQKSSPIEERLIKRKNSDKASCHREITMAEYQNHKNDVQAWILIAGVVYDVTDFIHEHPGGGEYISNLFGKDATQDFENFSHTPEMFEEYGVRAVGRIK